MKKITIKTKLNIINNALSSVNHELEYVRKENHHVYRVYKKLNDRTVEMVGEYFKKSDLTECVNDLIRSAGAN